MNFLKFILNIIFPIKCISCGEKGFDLCIKCFLKAPPVMREYPSWVFPLFDYRHKDIKKLIWLLKYKNRKRIAKLFAEVMYGKIMEELSELSMLNNFNKPMLIPIPLSNKRYRERGYNQSELICKQIKELDKENILESGKNILIKNKETEHQVNTKNRNIRLSNLSNSFSVKNPTIIDKRNIILIDDVLTTGATLKEAKKILKNTGQRKL